MFNKNKIVSKLLVEGMHCNSCAKRIEDTLKKNKDIKKEHLQGCLSVEMLSFALYTGTIQP